MSINNLQNISDFSKKNNNFSDFNIVNDLFLNLNFTKYRSNKNLISQSGGNLEGGDFLGDAMGKAMAQVQSGQMPQMPTQLTTALSQMGAPMGSPMSGPMSGHMGGPMGSPMAGPMSGHMGGPMGHMEPPKKICREETIQNPDGSKIVREICDNYMSMFPTKYLPKPDFVSGEIKTYTIPKGTVLFHSVDNKRGFNTKDIQLGNGSSIIFFTPNFRLASDKIQGCSIDKQKSYIHAFEVIQDIPNIYIKLPYDTSEDVSIESLKEEFCGGSGIYNGVGFFYPKNEIELFNKTILSSEAIIQSTTKEDFHSEFGLCNPTPYLKYLYTQRCQSLRKLSQPYRFDKYGFD
jgi:hypothetical protein